MTFIPDQAQKPDDEVPRSLGRVTQVSPPPQQPDPAMSENHGTQSARVPPPTRVESSLANAPALHTAPRVDAVSRGTKRKRTPKRHLVHHDEDTPSDSDSSIEFEGDGFSSGEDVAGDPSATAKRPRTSTITTRLSARTTTPGSTGTGMPADHGSAPPTPIDAACVTIPSDLADPQPPDTRSEAHTPPTTADVVSATSTDSAGDRDAAKTTPASDPQPVVATAAQHPTPANTIYTGKVPDFLLNHGKGTRRVNIFEYLNELQDPHFRRVLVGYLNFEANDKSRIKAKLPTPHRPVEVAQWSQKARPACLPDYEKGGKTFSMFVDSIFAWWSSLQPAWRPFNRGTVSRQVQGEWGHLYAPHTNGLLSIVILVYWWARILEEKKPEDGVRADYEFFADDVAWVLSNLSI